MNQPKDGLTDPPLYYDFDELASRHPSLKPYITTITTSTTHKNELDLNDQDEGSILRSTTTFQFSTMGQYELLKVILLDKYNFVLQNDDYVSGNLIPTVPSRLMYLNIIKQVLKECELTTHSTDEVDLVQVKGLDIGIGTYAIYPILAHLEHNWEVCGTDIDQQSLDHAFSIIKRNGLDLELLRNDGLIGLKGHYDFMCCNPPFYESFYEIEENMMVKGTLQRDKVIGTSSELVYENGGEIGFVKKLILESTKNDLCDWYSSLICKRRSIDEISNNLIENGCVNWFWKSFQLGLSKKWIIFWSWKKVRPIVYHDKNYKNVIPTVIEFKINLQVIEKELKKIEHLKMTVTNDFIEVFSDHGDVWSRSFRRRKQIPLELLKLDRYVFIIYSNSILWKYGQNPKIFQSFHTLIKKGNI